MPIGLDTSSPDPGDYDLAMAHAQGLLPANMPTLPRHRGVVAVVMANKLAHSRPGSDPVRLARELEIFLWVCNPVRLGKAPGGRRGRH